MAYRAGLVSDNMCVKLDQGRGEMSAQSRLVLGSDTLPRTPSVPTIEQQCFESLLPGINIGSGQSCIDRRRFNFIIPVVHTCCAVKLSLESASSVLLDLRDPVI